MSILARRRRASLPDDPRLRVERWLSQRGVPQIISGYSTEQQIDRRSLPLILVWVAIGVVVLWVGRSDGLTPGVVAGILATLVLTSLVLLAYARLRRHFPFGPFRPLGFADVMVLALTPGAVTAVLTRDILALPGMVPVGAQGMNISVAGLILLGHGAIFAIMALGLPELAMWGGRHLRSQLVPISPWWLGRCRCC